MIARKRELEARKNQPVSPDIPEITPEPALDDTKNTDTENHEFESNEIKENEVSESEDLNTEEEKKEAENA